MPIPTFNPMAGSNVAADVLFTDDTGVAADPTTVTISVRDPAGDVTTPTVTHSGTGVYRAEFFVDVGGRWVVQAEGEGALVVQDELQFDVRFNVIP